MMFKFLFFISEFGCKRGQIHEEVVRKQTNSQKTKTKY